jgi:hypothetical protein
MSDEFATVKLPGGEEESLIEKLHTYILLTILK